MGVWAVFLIPVSLAVTAMSSNCTPQVLDEPPGHIRVRLGSSLTLYCSSTCPGAKVRMTWYFSGSESAFSQRGFTCINEFSEETTWCNYTIGKVQVNDSGRYLCLLTRERPTLVQIFTNGTDIVVENEMDALATANPVTETPGFGDVIQSKTFLMASGASALLLVLLGVTLCAVKRRRRRRLTEMTCPVYGNTRPVPSATGRQKTSEPDTASPTGRPPQDQRPLKGEGGAVPKKDP